MVDALKKFVAGEKILPEDTNDNNDYLENLNVQLKSNLEATVQANLAASKDYALNLIKSLYPVGSIYISTTSMCPLAALFGTWTLVSNDKALWTGNGSNANTTIAAGLPNITGALAFSGIDPTTDTGSASGAFTKANSSGAGDGHVNPTGNASISFNFNASRSSSIYGKSSTVQPPAYVVNVWRRTA